MKTYAKRRWNEYNRDLVNRGSIAFWVSQECLDSWKKKTGEKGHPSFSTAVIQAGVVLKSVYHLPRKSLQGFLGSILFLRQVDLKSPNYSLFCKRAKEAAKSFPKLSKRRPLELAN